MTKGKQSIASALAGVFGLPLNDRALWPDIILGAALAFALLFSLGSLVNLAFDFTFLVSTLAALLLILLAKVKKAVLGGALLFVGVRSVIALLIRFELKPVILAVGCFVVGGFLLRGYRQDNR